MKLGRVLALAGVLSLSGVASAESLIGRVGDAIDTWTTGALLEAYGSSRPLMIGGRDVSLNVAKAGRIIKWGGPVLLTAGLLNDSLHWFYDEAQKSANPALDSWWRQGNLPGYPSPVSYKGYEPAGVACQVTGYHSDFGTYKETRWVGKNSEGGHYGFSRVLTTKMGMLDVSEIIGPVATYAQAYNHLTSSCPENYNTLNDLNVGSPGSADGVRQIVKDYLLSHPEIGYAQLSPVPNANQKADAVVDPGLDTDIDGQTDGDETQTGMTTNTGNRPNPGDGGPSDPNDPTSKSPDTDDDGVPDWRDGDDDNDGTPDNDEPTTPADCQKNPSCNPESERDTDNDGTPDRDDSDDDNDGFPDALEEAEGSDPKDPDDKPTDKPCAAGQVRGPGGRCEDKPEPPPCPSGTVRGADGLSCVPKPKECPPGSKLSTDGKSCVPDKDDDKCPVGTKSDGMTPPKCIPDDEPDDPTPDDCGAFGIKRLLTHTGHYLRDVVFPCEDDYGWIDEIREAASTKFPFSLTSSLDNMVSYSGSSGQSAALPSKLGPFDLDWSWLAPLISVVGLLFKGFIGWIAVDIILSRLSGQVVIK